MTMSELEKLRQKIMTYYHSKILKFYAGSSRSFDLPHMHFESMESPRIILHDDEPVFIGRIEVNKEGISNFIHCIPLTIGCDDRCETLSMQDFIIHGRLPSLSTIRQIKEDTEDKKFYVYQTIDNKKSELQEIFPLLRANSSQTSYILRQHLNHLLKSEVTEIKLNLSDNKAEFEWIEQNSDRFNGICKRLDIAMFKTSSDIMLTCYSNAAKIDYQGN
jgi:hypothetical protein